MKTFILFIIFSFFSISSMALTTEIGTSYSRKKQTFDSLNYLESESTTASVSLYFWERIALELSYTQAYAVQQQKAGSNNAQTVYQNAVIMGSDLIFMLADRTAVFQPYLKGGAAQVTKSQKIVIENLGSYTLEPDTAVAPSYGAGLKIMLTQQFSIKMSYDIWKSPLGNGVFTDDTSLRTGVTWLF